MFHKVGFVATKIQSFFLFSAKMSNYLTPPIAIGYKSCCVNFSQPILSVSKASVPLVRCSRRSSSDSGCFHQKCADEAMRNRRWCRWLLPTKEKPLSYVGWAQDKGFKTLNNLFDWYTTKVALSFITTSIKLFRI